MGRPTSPAQPDYGIDAPGVIRNLFLVGGLCLAVYLVIIFDLWSGVFAHVDFKYTMISCAIGFNAMGVWMLWTSKFGKVREREWILNQIPWTGNEQVLDIGCGRGLMLIGAAKRLTTGKAVGIDIWNAEDLTGNRPEATLENARRENVADRVEVRTADMRQLPFADGSFDVVVSCVAIHNLYQSPDREQAIREIARVLKPAGQALIADIRHLTEYESTFAKHGCPDVRWLGSALGRWLLTITTFGSLRPGTLLARKAT